MMLIRLDSHELSERIIGCAIEVHRTLGPGLLESVYEAALAIEFRKAHLNFKRQIGIPVFYKGELIGEHKPDFIVEEAIVVEIKRVERIDPVHIAQVITYLRMTGLHSGLILNFNVAALRAGSVAFCTRVLRAYASPCPVAVKVAADRRSRRNHGV